MLVRTQRHYSLYNRRDIPADIDSIRSFFSLNVHVEDAATPHSCSLFTHEARPSSARDQAVALEQVREPVPANSLEAISRWINDRFSAAEIKELSPDDFRVESHACSCSDTPDPHFPYLVVLFTTPRGDLVVRPEGGENMAKFTPLAVRTGDQYCKVESEENCYGSFANVCEFTDFRYGPLLQPFFPTCK